MTPSEGEYMNCLLILRNNYLIDFCSCGQFSIQLDDSTDVSNAPQLIVLVRYPRETDNLEDFCFARIPPCPLSSREDNGRGVLQTFGHIPHRRASKLGQVCSCLHGQSSSYDRRSGMVAQIKSVNPNIIAMHCMLHGQALAAKDMEPVLHSVLNTAISAVNFVKSRPLQSRLFGSFAGMHCYTTPRCDGFCENLTELYLGSNPLKKLSIHSDVFPHLEDLALGGVSESMVEWDISDKYFLRSLTSLHSYNAEFDIQTYRSLFKLVDSVENLHLIKDELFDEEGHLLMDFNVQSCWDFTGFLCFMSSSALVLLTLLSSFIFHFLRWQLVYGFYLLQAFLYDTKRGDRDVITSTTHLFPTTFTMKSGFTERKPIIENITDAIYSSRKTLCVISRRYLQSEWCSREIQMASFRLFDEQKDVLILLFLEEISSNQLSPFYRMRKLVKSRTYLSWTQARSHKGLFWEKVRRALESGNEPGDNHNPLTANVLETITS
ncbi:hypothetical protein WMY93_026236 [Mugilogobius chulae]|uniref:TIR domain-containing protein n=1 Tax=Mugilogobius chulae TaxID=88201 RepID=A0AAW0N2L9_9GOBI